MLIALNSKTAAVSLPAIERFLTEWVLANRKDHKGLSTTGSDVIEAWGHVGIGPRTVNILLLFNLCGCIPASNLGIRRIDNGPTRQRR